MFLINGQKQTWLAASDRATQFGDGCFTTARIQDGHVIMLTEHIRRLQDACIKLMITFEQWELLQLEMETLAREHKSGVLKVIITRGSGGRGYSRQLSLTRPNFVRFCISRALFPLATEGNYANSQPYSPGPQSLTCRN